MFDLMNSGMLGLASLAMSLLVLVIGLVLWFFINRASSRTHEQIELLETMVDLQKRQNALLRRLCEANEPEKAEPVKVAEQANEQEKDEDMIRLVAER
ncbi:hypothetical protein GJV06_14575 [Enterobacteriaceae bacterium RIT691]|nr:hypothetical protein [Enterobacteriaceae bacterium RIT691]